MSLFKYLIICFNILAYLGAGVLQVNAKDLRLDKPLEEQITKPNTIYEVRHDFDLHGKMITIPQNKIGFVSPERRYEAPTVARPPQM